MTADPQPDRDGDDTAGETYAPHRMDSASKHRLLTAADRAPQRYPGPIGELLRQELLSWMVFGHQLGSALIMRIAEDLLAE